jgi:hypothetical protein
MTQQNLCNLVNQDRRDINTFPLKQGQITGLQGGQSQQAVAKAQPNGVVVSGVSVFKLCQGRSVNIAARRQQKALVNSQFKSARGRNWGHLRTLQQVAQKVIGDDQVAILVFAQQGVATANPEIRVGDQLNAPCEQSSGLQGLAFDTKNIVKPMA